MPGKLKLTKTVVDGLESANPRGTQYLDSELQGFGVTVYPSGKKAFFVRYGPRSRRRRMTIGTYGVITVKDARETARQTLASAAKGEDPARQKELSRERPSFRVWCERYLEGVRLRKKRPELDETYLRKAVSRWGSCELESISPQGIEAMMQSIVEETRNRNTKKLEEAREAGNEAAVKRLEAIQSPGITSANRFLASVRACLQAAWRAGWITENPAAKVVKFRENTPRDRVLSEEEMQRVLAALDAEPSVFVKAAFQMLIETGARKSEVLRTRWEDLDLDGNPPLWRIARPKNDKPQVIPLPARTVAMLRDLPRVGPYVIPGRSPQNPMRDLRNPWARIQKEARLEGVTIHDLRRTFGLHVARQAGLHIASRLLRHSDVRITEKVYAPLGIEELARAMEKAQRNNYAG